MDKDSFRAVAAPPEPSAPKEGVVMGQDRDAQEGQDLSPGRPWTVVGIQDVGRAAHPAAMDAA